MVGLLDPKNRNALSMGLLNFGGGLMAAGAPTTDPGASQRLMGQAVQGFGNAYQGAQQHQTQQELRAMQIDEAKRKAAAAKQQQAAWSAAMNPASAGAGQTTPGGLSMGLTGPAPAPTGPGGLSMGAPATPATPTNPLQTAVANLTPQQRATLQALGPEQGLPLLAEMAFAKPTAKFDEVLDANGRPIAQVNTLTGKVEAHPNAPKEVPPPSKGDLVQIPGPTGQPIWVLAKDAVGKPAVDPNKDGATRQWEWTIQQMKNAGMSDAEIATITANKERYVVQASPNGISVWDNKDQKFVTPPLNVPAIPGSATPSALPLTSPQATAAGAGTPPAASTPIPSSPTPAGGYSQGTGGSGVFGGIVNTLTDLASGRLAAPSVEQAASALDQLKTRTKLDMASGGDQEQRRTNMVMEMLDKFTADPKSLMQGDARSLIKLTDTRNLIARDLQQTNSDIEIASQTGNQKRLNELVSRRNSVSRLLDDYNKIINGWKPRPAQGSGASSDKLKAADDIVGGVNGG